MTFPMEDLESINAVIDLCIDRELFTYITPNNHQGRDQFIFLLSVEAKLFFENLFIKVKPSPNRTPLPNYPIIKICLPKELAILINNTNNKYSYTFTRDKSLKSFFDKYWSTLFYVKMLRAEIQRRNIDEFINIFDDLLLLLESCIPQKNDLSKWSKSINGQFGNYEYWQITLFTYLMEMSAIAFGDASLGYAERANKIIETVHKPLEKARYGYDRWIWYNKGVAFQHAGRNKKAILEYNQVIATFFSFPPKGYDVDETNNDNTNYKLEFCLNVYPSILQRASINNKMQLSYHALQTLSDNNAEFLLKSLLEKDDPGDIFYKAAKNLIKRRSLLEIEAYLQQHRVKDAKNKITKLGNEEFLAYNSLLKSHDLPETIECPSPIKTQLVEQSFDMYLELIRDTSDYYNRILLAQLPSADHTFDDILRAAPIKQNNVIKIIKTIHGKYWPWVNDNRTDRKVFFSRLGLALAYAIELHKTLCRWRDRFSTMEADQAGSSKTVMLKLSKYCDAIICALTQLYFDFREYLPITIGNRKVGREIAFEDFRSDDLPDYVAGITSYYEAISNILTSDNQNNIGIIKQISSIFNRKKGDDIIAELQEDQNRFLDALAEWHKEFGENLHIGRIKRYNQRLIWRKSDKSHCGDPSGVANPDCLAQKGDTNEAFSGLLACVPNNCGNEDIGNDNYLDRENYQNIMSQAEEHFLEHLRGISIPQPVKFNALRFMGLQRWNSLTPAQGKSVGGGYFIYRTNAAGEIDLGIAIDPGFDFVRNYFRMGFSLRDIDIILISHSHPDHIWDFESIVQLLKELHDKTGVFHKVNVILTLGAYDRLRRVINNQSLRIYIHPLVIDIRKEIDKEYFDNLAQGFKSPNKAAYLSQCFRFEIENYGRLDKYTKQRKEWVPTIPNVKKAIPSSLEIWPTRAYHDDYSELSDCFGFLVRFRGGHANIPQIRFGYTGDTKWVDKDLYDSNEFKEIADQYSDCDVLLMHLGSLINHKKNNGEEGKKFKDYYGPEQCDKLIRKSNHPYLMGMIRFLTKIYSHNNGTNKLILIGEFGEELKGGIRADLVRRFKKGIVPVWPILPVDVGLDVVMNKIDKSKVDTNLGNSGFKFLCVLCEHYHDVESIDYMSYGQDEAIFNVCKTCKKAVPLDVQQLVLRNLYEKGRPLRTDFYDR